MANKQQMNWETLGLHHAKLDSAWTEVQEAIFRANEAGKQISEREMKLVEELATYHSASEALRLLADCTA